MFTVDGWTYYSTPTKYFKKKYVGDCKWKKVQITIQEFAVADAKQYA